MAASVWPDGSCLVWYSTITIYVTVQGYRDIRRMLSTLGANRSDDSETGESPSQWMTAGHSAREVDVADSGREAHPTEQIGEAGVAAKVVERRLNLGETQPESAVRESLF